MIILEIINTLALVVFVGFFSYWFWSDTIVARKIMKEIDRTKSSDEQSKDFARLNRLARIYDRETKIKPPTD